MKLVNLDGRVAALTAGGALDIEKVTNGAFGNDVFDALERWDELATQIAASNVPPAPVEGRLLGAPIPLPRQVFAIGLNYRDHAAEAGLPIPDAPPVFTKFPTCTTGPTATVELPSAGVDYEVELVVVIGKTAVGVPRERAWDYVAGYMVGQDLSERSVQLAGPVPQFSLGKSYTGFGPTGPAIVGLEELDDPDSLDIGCRVGAEVLQNGNTAEMIFDVRDLVVRLSAVCHCFRATSSTRELRPGSGWVTSRPGGWPPAKC